MTGFSSGEITAIIIQVVIVLVVIRRSYRMTVGVPYSGLRLLFLPALILILWVLDELESLFLTPWAVPYLVALDLLILVATALTFTNLAARMTHVYRDPSGRWSFRIGFSLAGLFIAAFAIRLALAVVLFPSALVFGAPTGGFPPAEQQAVLGVIDGIFSLSAGLIVGRSLGIHRKRQAAETNPPAALPS
ncbi:MAG TPA: hypothetical protein VJS68_03960 [Thermoplasmata archaeon]|nr:hypothetical protein [Thermoplasmata archaeon]